ncbi:uncharacterized protein CC84DRAFT_855725 [Paraphaeosphaeria sporulosa]|uniref:Uncharacterized protein n=1 Tax=Paraphaeosphaeria sporulosa TaxID=1460663 RepID=A0A177C9X3_9PLEO|nr:uncharacterized protein CC84DRAFT_855725 [Paraphaeosphaeria sporulosa]OAG03520.1 hypothetical protein CC84DRAFT_855725 [Paraphaeosphaeria sporulosa]
MKPGTRDVIHLHPHTCKSSSAHLTLFTKPGLALSSRVFLFPTNIPGPSTSPSLLLIPFQRSTHAPTSCIPYPSRGFSHHANSLRPTHSAAKKSSASPRHASAMRPRTSSFTSRLTPSPQAAGCLSISSTVRCSSGTCIAHARKHCFGSATPSVAISNPSSKSSPAPSSPAASSAVRRSASRPHPSTTSRNGSTQANPWPSPTLSRNASTPARVCGGGGELRLVVRLEVGTPAGELGLAGGASAEGVVCAFRFGQDEPGVGCGEGFGERFDVGVAHVVVLCIYGRESGLRMRAWKCEENRLQLPSGRCERWWWPELSTFFTPVVMLPLPARSYRIVTH